MSLVVLCPTRGRPQKVKECYTAFLATRATTSRMFFIVDDDDEMEYDDVPIMRVKRGREGMTDAINQALVQVWHDYDVVGFVGDDHRFRTVCWDKLFLDWLDKSGGGMIHGNDLVRKDIPTHIFGHSTIWQALGWIALPCCKHLYLDNAWRVIGDGAQCLHYMEDVIIEHMHPLVNKSEWDDRYFEVNSHESYAMDMKAFLKWQEHESTAAISRVKAVTQSHPG